jgi:hypothetical protein
MVRAGRLVLTGPFSSYPVRSLQLTFADMELKDIIEKTLKEYSVIFVANRQESLGKVKLQASSDLIRSVAADVSRSGDDLALLQLAFNDSGRYSDLNYINRKNQVPVEEIEDWIRAKGVGSFKSGFKRKIPVSDAKLINAIAWGIVKKKLQQNHKRRRWYAKSVGRDINNLYDTLVERYQEFILQDQKKQLSNGS